MDNRWNFWTNLTSAYSLVTATSGSAITKVKASQYKVTAYELVGTNKVVKDVQYIAVTDTQKTSVVGEVKSRVYTNTVTDYTVTGAVLSGSSLLAAATECFKITLDRCWLQC